MISQIGRPVLKLPVRERPLPIDHRNSFRRALCLPLEQFVNTHVGVLAFRAVPFHQHPLPLFRRHDRKRKHLLFRRLHRRFQQHAQVPHHAFHCRGIEQVRVVFEQQPQPLGQFRRAQRQIELRGSGTRCESRNLKPCKLLVPARHILQHQHRLK